MKEVIAETEIKPDYKKYVYFCGVNKKTGCLEITRADRSKRSKGIKN